MRKVYNFSAGPAMLPEEVMLQAQQEFMDCMVPACPLWSWVIVGKSSK